MQNRDDLGKVAETIEGIPVWGCLPGSVAAEAGVRYGDVVIAVNGKRTRDIDEYLEARELRNDGAEVVVFRAGQEVTIEMTFRRATSSRSVAEEQSVAEKIATMTRYVVEGKMLPRRPSSPPSKPN